jgi:hypothetical protein
MFRVGQLAVACPVFKFFSPATVPVGPLPSSDVRVRSNLPVWRFMVPVVLLMPLPLRNQTYPDGVADTPWN